MLNQQQTKKHITWLERLIKLMEKKLGMKKSQDIKVI